jgi:hypothetical protein
MFHIVPLHKEYCTCHMQWRPGLILRDKIIRLFPSDNFARAASKPEYLPSLFMLREGVKRRLKTAGIVCGSVAASQPVWAEPRRVSPRIDRHQHPTIGGYNVQPSSCRLVGLSQKYACLRISAKMWHKSDTKHTRTLSAPYPELAIMQACSPLVLTGSFPRASS